MGLRGPAPTPTPILEARGSWRAKEREGEVEYERGIPTCPAFLGKEAKAEWKRQSKLLDAQGVIQQVDRAALAIYCESWGEFVRAVEQIRQRSTDSDGNERPLESCAKLIRIKNEAAANVLRLAGQFGFTPAARVKLRGVQQPKEERASGKARFFAG